MVKTFASIILSSLILSGCNNCNIKEGLYTSAGGNEQSIQLTLLPENKFLLTHENWQPGHYDKRSTAKTSGKWQCNRNQISLIFQQTTYNAELVTIGNNPLGLPPDTRAIQVKQGADKPYEFLSLQMLYPEN